MTDFFGAIQSYLLDYLPNQKCLSANTIKSHKNCLNLFVSYLRKERHMKIGKITFAVIDKQVILDFLQWLLDTRNISRTSRSQRLSVLRTFFAYAGELDCTQIALEQAVKKIPLGRKQSKIVEYLSENALKAVLEQPDTNRLNGQRDRFFMTLMYDTAARVSELLDMKICDLKMDTEHPVAYLRGKGNKVRSVPVMLPKTIEHYKGYMRVFHPNAASTSADYLFYTNLHDERHRLTAAAVGKFMKKYGELAREQCSEVPERVHPHQLRHTRAIHLYRGGYPLVLVGEYLGHANPVTTKIYAYADSEMKRKALEKADAFHGDASDEAAVWEDNEEMMLQLVGLR
jgi:site-specific recombinase XerD